MRYTDARTFMPVVGLLLILALAAGCGRPSAPTGRWCRRYGNELRLRATGNIDAMTGNEANRQYGARELLAMVGSDPAIGVAINVCSDAHGDSGARRGARIIGLQKEITEYVILHRDAPLDGAHAKELTRLVEHLVAAFTEVAPH